MVTVLALLAVASLILTIFSAATNNKVPLWAAVLVANVVLLLQVLPLGR